MIRWFLLFLVCGCGEGVEPSWSEQIGGGPIRSVHVGPDGSPLVLGPTYVAKHEPGGARAWIWPDEQILQADLLDITVAGDGQIFALATFSGEIDWGGGTLSSEGQPDLVIVEIGPSGTAERVRHIASEGVGEQNVIAVDQDGVAWVVGSFTGMLDLGDGPLSLEGDAGTFVAGIAADGDVVAVDALEANATIEDVAVDTAGNLYVVGTMQEDPVDFGDGWTLDSSYDAFVIRRDAERRTAWAFPISGSEVSTHAAVSVAADDSIIAAGNELVLKIGVDGERRWSFSVAPCARDYPCGILNDLASDGEGGAFAVGVEFTENGPDSSEDHMAVWRLDADGGCRWAWSGGPDILRGVAVDAEGNAFAVSDQGTLLGFDR